MKQAWYLFTDMDRTIIPNGVEPESINARPLLRKWCAHDDTFLIYVSGRNKEQVQDAIQQFDLPKPDYVIGDVGTSIFHVTNNNWTLDSKWQKKINDSWMRENLATYSMQFANRANWKLQEQEKQSNYKISYYVPLEQVVDDLVKQFRSEINQTALKCNIVFSIDDNAHMGLLDILPFGVDKLQAIQFLRQDMHVAAEHCFFAGDSGNDLSVLSSDLQGILVANASNVIRREAIVQAKQNGFESQLFCAKGDWLNMNGNYAAGVLEGLAYFSPYWQKILTAWAAETGSAK